MSDVRAVDGHSAWLETLENVVNTSSNMVVITDPHRCITWVNATYTQITGWTLDECFGKNPRHLMHGPSTNPLAQSRLRSLLDQELEVSNFELVNHKKSGEPFWVSLNIRPLRDRLGKVFAYTSTQTDITERRQQQQRTAELGARLEMAQRLARLGRIECDERTFEVRWSSEIFKILGIPKESRPLSLKELSAFFHPADVSSVVDAIQGCLKTGDEIDVEFRVVSTSGDLRWVRCRGVPNTRGSRFSLPLVWTVQDVSVYKFLLQERQQRNEALQAEVKVRTMQLEQTNKELEEFSYALSHDLRTPLRHVASYAGLLKESLSEGRVEEGLRYAERVIHGAVQMRALIDGMLSFAKLGHAALAKEVIDVSEMILELRSELATLAGSRPLHMRVAPDLPVICADRTLWREVLRNLLGNAVKYSSHQTTSEIDIACSQVGNGVIYSIQDNGIGFDADRAEKLFSMFQRLHHDSRFEGAGIGLALVKRIVEGHGGRVWATSRPGHGSTFFVFMPSE